MGLDQYAYAIAPHRDNTDTSFVWRWAHESDEVTETRLAEADYDRRVVKIAQWRKHADLQGWMERLWIEKMTAAGTPPQPETDGWFAGQVVFNCQPVRLTLADLKRLGDDTAGDGLPHTEGFFFGQSTYEDRADVFAFLKSARQAIAQDMEVYYDSWW